MIEDLTNSVKETNDRSSRAETRAEVMQIALADLQDRLGRRERSQESGATPVRTQVVPVPQPPGAFITNEVPLLRPPMCPTQF